MLLLMEMMKYLKKRFAAMVYIVAVAVFLGLSQMAFHFCGHATHEVLHTCTPTETTCCHEPEHTYHHEALQFAPTITQTLCIQKIIEAGLLPLLLSTLFDASPSIETQHAPHFLEATAPPWVKHPFISYAPRLYPRA